MAERICFVIAPIGETDSETRKRSDQVLRHIIEPAVSKCGYIALRADKIAEPGLITSQVIQHIIDDPLVVADLTDRNPNVFYELAIRHAIRKPLVQLIKKGEQIPFDVAGMRTIELDHRDLDSAENAKNEIISQISALESNPSKLHATPISVSIDLQALRQSENPEQRSLGDVLAAVAELRANVASLAGRVEQSIDLSTRSHWFSDSTLAEYGNVRILGSFGGAGTPSPSNIYAASGSPYLFIDTVPSNRVVTELPANPEPKKEPTRKK